MYPNVELWQMLEARERRVLHQRRLLETYHAPVVCFTMNIAGPIKNSPLIREGFLLGVRLLQQEICRTKLLCLSFSKIDEDTGNEAFWVIQADPLSVKRITAGIEDHLPIGRLFDMDVLTVSGQKVSREEIGLPHRRCLICGRPAAECARSRSHSVAELQKRTTATLQEAVNKADGQDAAQLAVRALLYEVCTTPKPGLVDTRGSGSHNDMDLFSFLNSAAALHPYFEECLHIGRTTADLPPQETFHALRYPGMLAEGTMLKVTGGVNTHKGAIFSLGILCGAMGRVMRSQWSSLTLLNICAEMTQGLTQTDFAGVTAENASTMGQKLYLAYGITGVRGQAEQGFPAVSEYGMPVLEKGLAEGVPLPLSGCAAMLTMLCHNADTNMIARSNMETYQAVIAGIQALLEKTPYLDEAALQELDAAFIEKNLSPGGSADLLAMCYLLHFLKEEI